MSDLFLWHASEKRKRVMVLVSLAGNTPPPYGDVDLLVVMFF